MACSPEDDIQQFHVFYQRKKNNVLAPIIRLNSSALFILRLKNMNEVNAFIDENSALVN